MISLDDVLEEKGRIRDIMVVHVCQERERVQQNIGLSPPVTPIETESFFLSPPSTPKSSTNVTFPQSENELILDQDYCLFKPPKKIQYDLSYIYCNFANEDWLDKLTSFFEEKRNVLDKEYNHLLIYIQDEILDDIGEIKLLKGVEKIIQITLDFALKKTIYDSTDELDIKSLIPSNFTYKYVKKVRVARDVDKNRLTCQPWFRRYLGRLNRCGKGRLLQYTGTCYLNTAINMVTLSFWFKRLVVSQMNDYIERHPDSKRYIKSPLADMFVCPNVYATKFDPSLRYFYRFVYNLSCLGNKPVKREEDIMIQGSRELFSNTPITHYLRSVKPGGLRRKGEGGWASFAVLNYLLGSQTNFAILYYNKDLHSKGLHFFSEDQKTQYSLYKPNIDDLSEKLARYNPLMKNFNSLEKVDLSLSHTFDVILYANIGNSHYPKQIAHVLNDNFIAEVADLVIEFYDGDLHSVCGFECDGIPKVYDSGINIISEVDWKTLDTDDLARQFANTFYGYRGYRENEQIADVNINFALYVNKQLKHSLREQMCVKI